MSYTALQNKKVELIRKARDGSLFMSPITSPAIVNLTTNKTSEVQTVAITGAPTGGTFTLTFSSQTTAGIAYNATASAVQAALQALSSIGAGNVTVTGGPGPGTAWVVTFTGTLAAADQPAMTGSATGLTGGSSPTVTITTTTAGGTTTAIDLLPLPTGYEDIGWCTTDGVTYGRSTDVSEIRSFGSSEPTRSDVTKDTITMKATAQETKLLTIGMYTGADTSTLQGAAGTGEVQIAKATRPPFRYYRALGIYVDSDDSGADIFLGRFMPRARITELAEQKYTDGDQAVEYDFTLTGYEDSTLGYSHKWLYGGAGWRNLLTKMGITEAP
jgi:hypothetical protein